MKMKRNDFAIVVTAPSGAGKTTIIRRVLKDLPDVDFSVSATTRPMRSGEREGIDYYFISKEEFKKQIDSDEFVEWANVHENFYGTQKKELDRIYKAGKIPLLDIDVQGSKSLRIKNFDTVRIFIVPPSLSILEERLGKRGTDSQEQIKIRLSNAVSEMEQYSMSDYILVNDDLSQTASVFKSIVTAELHKTKRMSDFAKKILEDRDDNSIR